MVDSERERGFLELLNRHQKAIRRICRSYAWAGREEEDLFQEIVYQLWRSFSTYRQDSSLLTWAYRVSFNTAITALRRRTRRLVHEDTEASVEELPALPRSKPIDERLVLLHRALGHLDPVDRALIMLYLDGLTHREAGTVLGISEANVATKLSRAKLRLQSLVKQWETAP